MQIPDFTCADSGFQNTKDSRFLVDGLLLISAFRFIGMASMADFVIEGHVV